MFTKLADFSELPDLMEWANQDLNKKIAAELQRVEFFPENRVFVTQPLAELIRMCHFNYVSARVNELTFPDTGILRNNPALIDFGRVISSDHALREIKSRRCASANLREMLVWAGANWDGIERVVALGQVCEGERKVPSVAHLDRLSSERRLYVSWRSYDWALGTKFLVFPA